MLQNSQEKKLKRNTKFSRNDSENFEIGKKQKNKFFSSEKYYWLFSIFKNFQKLDKIQNVKKGKEFFSQKIFTMKISQTFFKDFFAKKSSFFQIFGKKLLCKKTNRNKIQKSLFWNSSIFSFFIEIS